MKRPPRRAQEIAIDRIVLPHGTVGTRRVRAAIERELTRLLGEQPALAGAGMPAAKVMVKAGADADAVGATVARQIHERMGKSRT
jgi:alpha-glucuronidase